MTEQLVATEIDGAALLLEVRSGDDPERDVGILRDSSFDGVVDSIRKLTRQLTEALEEVKPDKASLEFGVDVGVEAGQLTALLVKGSGNASLKITLEWGKAG
jgi:Trypsin-co-occurring domain 1